MTREQINNQLRMVREEIWWRENSDDRAYTGFYRERMRELLAAEARLSGLLRRLASPRKGDPHIPDQQEFAFT